MTRDDGYIDYKEFLGLMTEYYVESDLECERMMEAFAILDRDKDGSISLPELKAALLMEGSGIEEQDVVDLFNEIDTDGNGQIDYEGKICGVFRKASFSDC